MICIVLCSANYAQQGELFIYNNLNSPLISNNIRTFSIDPLNKFWIINENCVYNLYNDVWSENELEFNFDNDDWISDLITVRNEVWFSIKRNNGNNPQKIFLLKDTTFSSFDISLGLDPLKIIPRDDSSLVVLLDYRWPNDFYLNEILIIKQDGSIEDTHNSYYFLQDIAIKGNDIYSVTNGMCKYSDEVWEEIISPYGSHTIYENIWNFNGTLFVSGDSLYQFDGEVLIPDSLVNSFLVENNLKISSMQIENDSIFWIGTQNGHFLKYSNNTLTFFLQSLSGQISDIQIDKYGNKVFVIAGIGLAFFNENKIVGVDELENEFEFELSQNYPNPFNPVTNITYSLKSNTRVKIEIFDVLGNFINTPLDEEKSAGRYNLMFDASNYASGIYFYRIVTNTNSQTKKMVLIK